MRVFEVPGPDWLGDDDMTSCDTCGHWSSFDAGFKYDDGEYEAGWYEDWISCFGGAHYSWTLDEDGEDTAERFREFLTEMDTEEAQQILDELNRLGL